MNYGRIVLCMFDYSTSLHNLFFLKTNYTDTLNFELFFSVNILQLYHLLEISFLKIQLWNFTKIYEEIYIYFILIRFMRRFIFYYFLSQRLYVYLFILFRLGLFIYFRLDSLSFFKLKF